MNRALAEKAVRYAELAAQQAEAVAAWDEAAAWYRHAIDGLEDDPLREAALWVSLSLSERHMRNITADSHGAFMRAVEAYRRANSPRAFAAGVLRGLSTVTMGSDRNPYWGIVEEALEALGGAESPEAAHLLALASVQDRSAAGDRQAERARSMADSLGLGDDRWLWLLEERERARLNEAGEHERVARLGLASHERLLGLGPKVPGITAAAPLGSACMALLYLGEVGAAEPNVRRLERFAQDRRLPSVHGVARTFLGGLAVARGDRDELSRLVEDGGPDYRLVRLEVADALTRGDLVRASELLQILDAESPEEIAAFMQALKLRHLLARGQRDEAREVFDNWRDALDEWSMGPQIQLSAFASGCDGLLAFGDVEMLRPIYDRFVHYSYKYGPLHGEAIDLARGALALRLGDPEAAARHYRDGLEWARRLDVRFGLVEGRCLQGLADVAEARGDHALALEHLDGAAAKFAEYGAKLYLDQVLAKKEFLKA